MNIEEIKKIAISRDLEADKVQKIIDICERYGVRPVGNVFLRKPEDVEKIILLCYKKGYDVEALKTCFRRNARDVEKIFEICDEYGMFPESALFRRKLAELKESIDYVESNFGQRFVKPLVISKEASVLRNSMPYIDNLGGYLNKPELLLIAINEAKVLELTENELRERTAILNYLGIPIYSFKEKSKLEKLSSVYTLSKGKYEEFLEYNGVTAKVRAYQTQMLLEVELENEK